MQNNKKKVHFIAIGGSVMHALAIALKQKGFEVTGSDDQIFGNSKINLEKHGLLPEPGWDESRITSDLDAVILGMHARSDNEELAKARSLGVAIFSYPEFIMNESTHKQRVVISGSHGKTSITSMIIHVLKKLNRSFDFIVGSILEGIENPVKLSDAPVIIIEGDEYLSSPIDPTPKFLKYNHHIGLISGVAWDHMNVFPTEESYVTQFDKFADSIPKGGSIVYCEDDPMATVIGNKDRADVHKFEYKTHAHKVVDGKTFLITPDQKEVEVSIFGSHNMQNLAGALEVLKRLGVTDEMFYEAIQDFKGASRRLELIGKSNQTLVYKDFAHAPSKTKASIDAMKELSERPLIACLELHTFSSLNKDFLPQYKNKMNNADFPIVYFSPATLKQKNLPEIDEAMIREAFQTENLKIFTDSDRLKSHLIEFDWDQKNLLLMSSGNFGGIDVDRFAQEIINRK